MAGFGDYCSDSRCAEADDALLQVEVQTVFDGDGFLARAWNPDRREWAQRIPFRLAFIDAPEVAKPSGQEARDFLHNLITGSRSGEHCCCAKRSGS